jgi:hypothetical protein
MVKVKLFFFIFIFIFFAVIFKIIIYFIIPLLSKAKQFFRFITKSNNGGNALANIELTKQMEFIKYLDINENDLPIIKFWSGYLKIT